MFIVTQPSHFQVTAETEFDFISTYTGNPNPGPGFGIGKHGGRRWLGRSLPGQPYTVLQNSSTIVYDEYGGIAPSTPFYPTTKDLWLKSNTFLSVHYYSVQNNHPSTSVLLSGLRSFRATRKRDVPGEVFYKYPNFSITSTLSGNANTFFASSSGFQNSLVSFLQSRYNFATLPSRFSVKMLISWAKWTNKFRIPGPTYNFDPNTFYGRNHYFRTRWATNPSVNVGVGYLHSVYLYR